MGKVSNARRRPEKRCETTQPESSDFSKNRWSLEGDTAASSCPSEQNTLTFPISQADVSFMKRILGGVSGRECSTLFHREGALLPLKTKPEMGEKLLPTRAVVWRLGKSQSSVYSLVKRKRIPSYRVGRTLRFDPDPIREFEANCLEPSGRHHVLRLLGTSPKSIR